MDYEKYFLREDLVIKNIITFYYMELAGQFNEKGENHDFWEFLYVDKGEVEIYTDLNKYELSQGDIVFYKPNEHHRGQVKNASAPNLIIISFECSSACMDYFIGKSFRLGKEEREILSKLLSEGVNAFDPPVDSPFMYFPKGKSEAPFGSEQIIKNYLEILLILLIRKMDRESEPARLSTINGDNKSKDLLNKIIVYMDKNISESLTPEQICAEFAISRTSLMTIFREHIGTGVKEYFNKMKVDYAKLLIRKGQHNFTEIAELLGYRSVHYFSKHFKRVTDMTPTEYSRSIKALSGTNRDH